jgi:hypothetical protein
MRTRPKALAEQEQRQHRAGVQSTEPVHHQYAAVYY